MERSNHEDGYCGFDNLPDGMQDIIFSQLDSSTLKSCRLVCSSWNKVLSQGQRRILTKGTCAVYRPNNYNVHHTFSIWEYLFGYIQTICMCFNTEVDKPQLPFLRDNYLRITEVLCNDCSQLSNWIDFYNLQNITCVELLKCEIDVPTLVSVLKLTNLQELSLLDVEYLGLVDERGNRDPSKASKIQQMQKNLKKLHLRERNLWKLNDLMWTPPAPLSRFDVLSEALAQGTTNLESLTIECFDTGISPLDDGQHFSDLFRTLHTFLLRNAETLKELTLSTYDVEDGRRFHHINKQSWDLPGVGSDEVLSIFISHFRENQMHLIKLANMEKLSLGFRVVPDYTYVTSQFRETILPWVRRLKKLNKFHLSQIHRSDWDGTGRALLFIPFIRDMLPQNCQIELKILSSLDTHRVEHTFDTLREELNRLNFPNPQFQCDPPPSGASGYNDSTIQMKNGQTTWTFLYVNFKRLANIKFYTQNLQTLQKIKIQQFGVGDLEKIKIMDTDFLSIGGNALGLTHLEVEFCDLSSVTDFGLTGISSFIGTRMITNNDYTVLSEDIINPSLCSLPKLRVLKLSFVGSGVTDVTAHHLCSYYPPRGLVGGIYGKHKLCDNPDRIRRNHPGVF